ncbi:MAG TPA: MBL fold metallo-hydrolase [Acidobacteriaceae bacterium]|jgi:phosphoribosyl 1,2-cyclic phosphodiesterase|nr:MBL fold metallo-hydrolase [Acidobacteriaceae bacterium]
MMRMTVLSSGSRGNSTVVSSSRTRVLVDAGLSCRELLKRMALANEDPATLDAILITHEHQDHIAGLGVLARKLRIPVFITEPTHRAWVRMLTPSTTMTYAQWLDQRAQERAAAAAELAAREAAGEDANAIIEQIFSESDQEIAAEAETSVAVSEAEAAEPIDALSRVKAAPTYLPAIEHFCVGVNFAIGDIAITPFTIPHDAADPCGFVFEAEGARIGIATDLGYVSANVKQALKRCDVVMLESNHDLEMLRDGPYPWSVKQRVMSRVGHLSNDAASEFLEKEYDGGAAYVVLAHLSESNNLPSLARIAAENALAGRMGLLGNKLVLAQQAQPTESIIL